MKSIRKKLNITTASIIAVTNLAMALFIYKVSYATIKNEVYNTIQSKAETTAAQIKKINDEEFKMLSSIAKLDYIKKDTPLSSYDKWKMLNQISDGNSYYLGMAIYNEEGIGWTTTGKYQDLHEREYLANALKGKPSIMNPNWSPVNANLSTFYAQPVFSDSNKLVSVVVAVVNSLELCNTVSNITVGKSSNPIIIDIQTGKYVASSNQELVKDNKDFMETMPQSFYNIMDRIKRGESGTDHYTDAKVEYTVSFMPVGGDCNWAVICAAPSSDFYEQLHFLMKCIVAIFVISAVLIISASGLYVGKSIKPLRYLNSSIHEIASSDADLTKRIKVETDDEISSVVEGFNLFSAKLQKIIGKLKNTKENLVLSGEDLTSSIHDTTSSITQIIQNINGVHKQITNQNSSVQKTASSVNEIADNIVSLERMIEIQTAGVSDASAAVEQMIGNIASVNHSVEKMADSFDELQNNAQTGVEKQRSVNERIEAINSQSQQLQEANAAISAIAEQTNLLAMNAAIEAAHAGDAGKGFSVVADEIRKLSETSSAQSKTIGNHLNDIKNSINDVVSASEESSSSFQIVTNKIRETDELVRQIKCAMEEQLQGSKQINESLLAMNDSTLDVKTASKQISIDNNEILKQVQDLQNESSAMKINMDEMSIGARKINETGVALSDISHKMKDSIEEIGSQIDLFKV